MSGSRGWAARAEGHPVQPPTQGAQMGTGEVAALQARASDVDVRGRWSPLLGTLSGSGGGNVPILYCPPGSYQMPVQVAVSSCVASCPELQLPHTTTYFLPPRAPGVSLVDGVLGQILWVRRGEDYLLCARSPSSAKPQLPGARCTCGRTWARAFRAVVVAPSGGCSGDYMCPLGAGHSSVPALGVSKHPGLNVGMLS